MSMPSAEALDAGCRQAECAPSICSTKLKAEKNADGISHLIHVDK